VAEGVDGGPVGVEVAAPPPPDDTTEMLKVAETAGPSNEIISQTDQYVDLVRNMVSVSRRVNFWYKPEEARLVNTHKTGESPRISEGRQRESHSQR
jgi:hypothetical protein